MATKAEKMRREDYVQRGVKAGETRRRNKVRAEYQARAAKAQITKRANAKRVGG
jgi:hypothetical protein